MITIPLRPVANQTLQVQLGDQPCAISLAQTAYALHLTLSVDGELIVAGAICQDRNRIVRSSYLGFDGDLVFVDTEGRQDPTYDGLGDRYKLVWLTEDEVADLLVVAA